MFAAQAVARRGHGDEAAAAMIDTWEQSRDWHKGEDVDDSYQWRDHPFGWLIQFLAGAKRVDTVRGAREGSGGAQPGAADGRGREPEPGPGGKGQVHRRRGYVKGSGLGQSDQKDVDAAMEEVLVAELEDTGFRRGYGETSGTVKHGETRVCDAAGAGAGRAVSEEV